MLFLLKTFLAVVASILRSRAAVELENLALRYQIGVLQRSAAKRPKPTSGDRLFWICLCRLWCDWRSTLAIVKPETVVAWHRVAFRRFWTRKVRRGLPGRPLISCEVRDLIRKMCRENPRWGAPRIHGELLKLGINIAESSVSKYMVRGNKPPSQTWRTFLENHAQQLASTARWPDNNCERHFPLPNSGVTCCATAMRFSATTSENRCETWASSKSCRHRARLDGKPM